MNNFEFEHDGKKLWYSRSLACNLVCFLIIPNEEGFKAQYKVLANKRGQGCEFNKGLWNVPGGFIDFNEDAKDCAIRETYEECGVHVPKDKLFLWKLDTKPHGKRQTMVAVHTAYLHPDDVKDWEFTNKHSEPGEVEKICWMDVEDVGNYVWVNHQDKLIQEIYEAIH